MRSVAAVGFGALGYLVVFLVVRTTFVWLGHELRPMATHVGSLCAAFVAGFVSSRLADRAPFAHTAVVLAPPCALYAYFGYAGWAIGIDASLGAALVYVGLVLTGGTVGALVGWAARPQPG
jgi:hypothetical protein